MIRFLIAMAMLPILLLSACGGEEIVEETGTAGLVVKVVHVDGSSVMGASVELFESATDYQNNTNPIKSLETDELGEVYFQELPLKQYWFIAKFEKYSNATSVSTTGRKLVKDERMEKITQLRP